MGTMLKISLKVINNKLAKDDMKAGIFANHCKCHRKRKRGIVAETGQRSNKGPKY